MGSHDPIFFIITFFLKNFGLKILKISESPKSNLREVLKILTQKSSKSQKVFFGISGKFENPLKSQTIFIAIL